MSEFFVGQRVVCINDSSSVPPHNLKCGREYIIRAVGSFKWNNPDPKCGDLAVWLEGIWRPFRMSGVDVPFGHLRFRPLESKAISIFRKIAQDVTEGRKLEIVE